MRGHGHPGCLSSHHAHCPASDLKAVVGLRCPSQGRGFFRDAGAPRPSAKKVFQLLPPGFRCFSPLSLSSWSLGQDIGGWLRAAPGQSLLLDILLTFPQVKLGPWKLWARGCPQPTLGPSLGFL